MSRKLIVNRTCPYCGEQVADIPDYVLKKTEDHQNVEWVQTKRGLKQYFHTSCFNAAVNASKQVEHEHVH